MAYIFDIQYNNGFIDINIDSVITLIINDRLEHEHSIYYDTIRFKFPSPLYIEQMRGFKMLKECIETEHLFYDVTLQSYDKNNTYTIIKLDKYYNNLRYTKTIVGFNITDECRFYDETVMLSINIELNKVRILNMIDKVIKIMDECISNAVITYKNKNQMYMNDNLVFPCLFPDNDPIGFLKSNLMDGSCNMIKLTKGIYIYYDHPTEMFGIEHQNIMLDYIEEQEFNDYLVIKIPKDEYIKHMEKAFNIIIKYKDGMYIQEN